jgi:cellobiose phosphorylase
MINPISHGKSAEDVAIYKAEPYVMAADVYGVHPHTGRGGWTWYTGSAGWMYQLIIESFLGLNRKGDELWFEPCVPEEWKSFKMRYHFKDTVYDIEVIPNPDDRITIVDGVEQDKGIVQLVDDKRVHVVTIKCPTFTKNFGQKLMDVNKIQNLPSPSK